MSRSNSISIRNVKPNVMFVCIVTMNVYMVYFDSFRTRVWEVWGKERIYLWDGIVQGCIDKLIMSTWGLLSLSTFQIRAHMFPSGFRSAVPMFNRNKLLWSTDSWVLIVVVQINKRHVSHNWHRGPHLGSPGSSVLQHCAKLGTLALGRWFASLEGWWMPVPRWTQMSQILNTTSIFHFSAGLN